MVVELDGEQHHVQLKLSSDELSVQKEELAYTASRIDHVDAAVLAKERTVQIRREKVGGLGLSVKGGAEHNLPILISRIFKDQAADSTGQVFVGDAILKVNGTCIEKYSHDEAVCALKNAGPHVTLVLKYFPSASVFLAKARWNQESKHSSSSSGEFTESQWTDILSVRLLGAYITRYKQGTDELRSNSFEVIAVDGSSTGVIQLGTLEEMNDWLNSISQVTSDLNSRTMMMANRKFTQGDQVVHMCWACERVSNAKYWSSWKPIFLALKGAEVLMFDTPPLESRDWSRCQISALIHECLFCVLKTSQELADRRSPCFVIETGHGVVYYLNLESKDDLQKLEKSWHRANYNAIKQIKAKTFGCTWHGEACSLTLDFETGFSLYNNQAKTYRWRYRFSQLKGSSDDGASKLKLHFLNEKANTLEARDLECASLQTLLFSMHAFLSAKLASVDPDFLIKS